MLNEKPSDNFHWKNKLAGLESLPGEVFNKEEAWGKLHKRMQKKPGSKKATWYWAAAACLFLAIIIPSLFLSNKKETAIVKNNVAPRQTKSPVSNLLKEKIKDTLTIVSSQSTQAILPALANEKHNRKIYLSGHNIRPLDIKPLKAIEDKKEKEEFIAQQLTINAEVPADVPIHITVAVPEKQKLKVVHINELGDPVEEYPNTVRSHDRRSLVKFINQEVNTSLPSGTTGFNIFKTKNTPSN